MINILYFSWMRERIGHGSEEIPLPVSTETVGDLIEHLRQKNDGYAAAFANPSLIRTAVGQEHVGQNHPIKDGDEIAFFPPVTGG